MLVVSGGSELICEVEEEEVLEDMLQSGVSCSGMGAVGWGIGVKCGAGGNVGDIPVL